MDAAEAWLKANDPLYAQRKAKELRKRKERADFYRLKPPAPKGTRFKKFPKGD